MAAMGRMEWFVTSPRSTVPLLLWPSCLDSKRWCIWVSHAHPETSSSSCSPVRTWLCERRLPAAPIWNRAHITRERAHSSRKGSLASPRPRDTSGKVYFGGLNVGTVSTLSPTLFLYIKQGDISVSLHVEHVAFSFIKGSLYL